MKLHARLVLGMLALVLPLCGQAHDTQQPISRTEGASQMVAVSAGGGHSCVLQSGGAVRCWGSNQYGQLGTDEERTGPYLSVITGGQHTCGLKADGSMRCWGYDADGQLGTAADRAGPYLAASAGNWHTCGLKPDGSLACWGESNYGQLGTAADRAGPYLSVSANGLDTCGLKVDGSLACWGYDYDGQLGTPTDRAGPYLAVAQGNGHTCALKPDGSVACWGNSYFGALGTAEERAGPYVAITANYAYTCALRPNGSVACWGESGKLGGEADRAGPFVAIANGYRSPCGVKTDGSISCWGDDNHYGQRTVPPDLQQPGSTVFGQIAAGNAHACDLQGDGSIRCWGDNAEGQANAPAGLFTQVATGDAQSCALTTEGKLRCWGVPIGLDFFNAQTSQYAWKQVALSPSRGACVLNAVQGVYAPRCLIQGGMWNSSSIARYLTDGFGIHCSVGVDGVGYCGYSPTPIAAAGPWQRLESGLNHQCGLKADGSIQCWGDNADGQQAGAPASSEQFRALSVGWNHACAIRDTGTLACWGSNLSGQTDAPAGTYVQVAAGNTFTCAIRSDGKRACWGASIGNPASLSDLPDGKQGVAYSQQIGINGPSAPTLPVFALMGGSLPQGLELSTSGLLEGTPTTMGSYSFTIDAEGDDGFAATRVYAMTIGDGSPPAIGYTLNGAAASTNPTSWYSGDVAIDWTLADAESAITSSTGCDDSTLSSDTTGRTFTCTATSAGGSNSVTTVTIRRDATAPTLAPVLPNPLLRGQGYVANPNATDATSGIASASCGVLDTSTLGSKSTSCSATDNAGNSNTVTLNYTVTTTCSNDGYTGTQLNWCRNICEMGYTGSTRQTWIRRWLDRYHDMPYCLAAPQTAD